MRFVVRAFDALLMLIAALTAGVAGGGAVAAFTNFFAYPRLHPKDIYFSGSAAQTALLIKTFAMGAVLGCMTFLVAFVLSPRNRKAIAILTIPLVLAVVWFSVDSEWQLFQIPLFWALILAIWSILILRFTKATLD